MFQQYSLWTYGRCSCWYIGILPVRHLPLLQSPVHEQGHRSKVRPTIHGVSRSSEADLRFTHLLPSLFQQCSHLSFGSNGGHYSLPRHLVSSNQSLFSVICEPVLHSKLLLNLPRKLFLTTAYSDDDSTSSESIILYCRGRYGRRDRYNMDDHFCPSLQTQA